MKVEIVLDHTNNRHDKYTYYNSLSTTKTAQQQNKVGGRSDYEECQLLRCGAV